MAKPMKVFEIPQEVRDAGEGDEGKCGGCNWESDRVFMMGTSLAGAIEAFGDNQRGLCGNCMTELLSEGDYQIHSKVEEKARQRRTRAAKKTRSVPRNSIHGLS